MQRRADFQTLLSRTPDHSLSHKLSKVEFYLLMVVVRLELIEVLAGARVYLFRRIFHDWDQAKSKIILENTRLGMNERFRVLVADTVLPNNWSATRYGFAGFEYDELWRYGKDRVAMGRIVFCI